MYHRVAGFCLLWTTVFLCSWVSADERKKIVLVAGPKSHGPVGNRIHDYPWSVKLLKVMLDNSNVRDKVRVEYHLGGWPKNPSTFDDADTILVVSDGRDGDKYQEAPHFRDAQQTARIQEQIDRGCGFATFHFSTFGPDARAAQSFQWTGGYFDWENNGKREWYSAIKTLDAPVSLSPDQHPILRGVKPFKMREEFYYNIRFASDGVTPLWSVPRLDGRSPDGKTVAWAKLRPDGGRGFGTTCGHFYDNWKHESFRRTILNALVWTAGLDPPAEGVDAPFFTHEQITLALSGLGEDLGEGSVKRATVDARPIRVRLFAGNEAHAWHNWKKTTPAIKELLERDPRIQVDVSNNIEDLAKLDRKQVDVVLQNYVNWQDSTELSMESKAAFVEFLRSGGGLVLVHFANGAFHFSLPDGAGESDWPEYRKIVRRVWNHHGKGEAKSGHDAFGEFDVRVVNHDSPLTRGLKATFRVEDELYFRQDGAEPITPLIVARSKITNRHEPLAWTYQYGNGRVFQTLLGHSEKTYNTFEPRELLRRAVAWSANRAPLQMEPQRDSPPKAAAPVKADAAASSRDRRLVVDGKIGNAFNANSGRLHVAGKERLRKPPLTVDFWTKLNGAKSYNILVASETKQSIRHWEIFTVAGSGLLALYIPGAKPDHVRTSTNICDSRWHRVRMAWEADRVRFWVDGKLVADQRTELRAGASRDEPFAIGGLVSGQLACNGLIDNLLIRAGAHPPPQPGARTQVRNDTLGYWSFDAVNANGAFPAQGEVAGEARPFDRGARANPPAKVDKARPAAADHWGRTVVGFDWTESDSVDGRWNQTQVGRFLACTMVLDGQPIRKGLAVRLGADASTTALYDTKTMQLRAAWSGGFLHFDPARYGLIRHPQPKGELMFSSAESPAWPEGFRYQGAFRNGARHVLAGDVAGIQVFDSSWSHDGEDGSWIERTLEVAPRKRRLSMQLFQGKSTHEIGDAGTRVAAVDVRGRRLAIALVNRGDAKDAVRLKVVEGKVVVDIAPTPKRIRFSILYQSRPEKADVGFADRMKARIAAARCPPLTHFTEGGPSLWKDPIETRGKLGDDTGPYAVDRITLPIDNPYKALMFVGGHDFFANGEAVICTVHGDVWVATGIDQDLDVIRWRRYATGLYQPLGLRVVNDKVYVLGRDQITRLHDLNEDGEADYYENFNNDALTSTGTHDYVTCLESDSSGNFYFMHAKQGLVKVSSDGKKLSIVATGFRNPNGMGLGPNGQLTAAPQEGEWTPGSNIALVKQGGYYGFGGPKITAERPLGYDLPWCWIPRRLDNSCGGQVWTNSNWGPLGGHMIHLSFGQCTAMQVIPDDADPERQAAVIPLPWKFDSGVIRGRTHPRDGQLYLSGMTGWVSNAALDGCFHRVRYTGKPMLTPTKVKSWRNGVSLTFSEPLEKASAEDADRYHVEQWTYRYSGSYGSEDYQVSDSRVKGRDELEVGSATMLDSRTVFLEIPNLRPAMQTAVRFDVRSEAKRTAKNTAYLTLHRVPSQGVDASRLARRSRPGALTSAQRAALRPGLLTTISSHERLTHHVTRMAVVRAEDETPLKYYAQGFLKTSIRSQCQFTAEGRGFLTLEVNGAKVMEHRGDLSKASPATVELNKGFNRIAVGYESSGEAAEMRLLWSGDGFDFEPIPPSALFHDQRKDAAVSAEKRQRGRQLFADLRCARCHKTSEALSTVDAQWKGPDLKTVGERVNAAWLVAWLRDPQAHRPSARMPRMLSSSMPESNRQSRDLAAYLTNGVGIRDKADHSPKAAQQGLVLFESLACVACHRFTPPSADDEFQRTSLFFAAAKYQSGAIAEFLQQPNRHYAATKMPTFELSQSEAMSLEAFIRSRSEGEVASTSQGDPAAGEQLFAALRCVACHDSSTSGSGSLPNVALTSDSSGSSRSCLNRNAKNREGQPRYAFAADERDDLQTLLNMAGQETLSSETARETSRRWMNQLRCVACHDRDGARGRRGSILLDEGELGNAPEVYPSLTWAGEKLRHDWTKQFLSGDGERRVRPWLRGRMPAFPAYATRLAAGLAEQHGMSKSTPRFEVNSQVAAVGERLIRKTVGLDCRQCHAVGDQAPTGDDKTKIAPGINFVMVKQRLREDYYRRFVLDPPRLEISTKMPRFALDRKTTPLRSVYDGDAARQFDAIWHYLQGLVDESTPTRRQ